jgi:nifR3 family TIM-barrel protein
VSLKIGTLDLAAPVVLAPMAGITNAPFRRLCRSFLDQPDRAGLLVSEMITARGLVERNEKTLRMARFADDEPVRSIQLYGTDPGTMGQAVRMLVSEGGADHVDINFGCPVAKITRKGGGAALPARPALFGAVVRSAVAAAETVPVTVKMRVGLDRDLVTFLEAGRIAAREGVAAVALHGRTAKQHYSGRADWSTIGELRAALPADVPVLGNGDIWQASDALKMVEETGCDGVVVGRGCLGRPWLFRDLARAFDGEPVVGPPLLAEVLDVLRRHAVLLADWLTEPVAVRDLRKHVGWYLQGYPLGGLTRRDLTTADTLDGLFSRLDALAAEHGDMTQLPEAAGQPRGKTSGPRKVVLPEGWLDNRHDPSPRAGLDDLAATSGG